MAACSGTPACPAHRPALADVPLLRQDHPATAIAILTNAGHYVFEIGLMDSALTRFQQAEALCCCLSQAARERVRVLTAISAALGVKQKMEL